jgi:hypothetical protein
LPQTALLLPGTAVTNVSPSDVEELPLPPPQATKITAEVNKKPRANPVFLETLEKFIFHGIF